MQTTASTVCSQSHHEALKLSPALWAELAYVGVQTFDDGGPDLVLRNCSCGSTLAVEVLSAKQAAA